MKQRSFCCSLIMIISTVKFKCHLLSVTFLCQHFLRVCVCFYLGGGAAASMSGSFPDPAMASLLSAARRISNSTASVDNNIGHSHHHNNSNSASYSGGGHPRPFSRPGSRQLETKTRTYFIGPNRHLFYLILF